MISTKLKSAILAILFLLFSSSVYSTSIFINEIHYDNVGTDAGEAIEIAGPAGTNLNGWELRLYNGSNDSEYGSQVSLSGILNNDTGTGWGFLPIFFPPNGLQNGSNDGIVLIDPALVVVQFLSYEGILTAASGVAAGLTSTDIGVHESSSTPVGFSLQLTGTGNQYEDFTWQSPMMATFGGTNSGQTFTSQNQPIPEPGSLGLFVIGIWGLLLWRYRFRKL